MNLRRRYRSGDKFSANMRRFCLDDDVDAASDDDGDDDGNTRRGKN